MDERPTVIVAELSKEFDNKYVFKNMNFVLEDNEIIAIIGPSGCGKSTLLRMISGLETIEKGKVETANIEKNSIGYIFQKPVLYPHLNVEGNIALGISEKLSRRQRKVLIETELRTVGLEGFLARKIDSLSGGEAQRITVVRALLNKPNLLLLDEPFSALDIPTRRKIAKDTRLILKSKNIPAIHVTHDPEEAQIIADRVLKWHHLFPDQSEE
jgi:ABC-type nitrate/sulfonate/bicarbonate transport system ATPase subunit|tara:strand:+ start:13767 stop:14405 length:639 start_codon:yes stop_codon:yes gene_type:complete